MTKPFAKRIAGGVIAVLVIVTVHLGVSYRLPVLIRQVITRSGDNPDDMLLALDDLSVDFWRGLLHIQGFTLNTRSASDVFEPLFRVGLFDADISWTASLRRRRPVLRHVKADDLKIRLVRYPDQSWNFVHLFTGDPAQPVDKALPRLDIERLTANLILVVEDHTVPVDSELFSLSYKLNIDIQGLRTGDGGATDAWADISVTGSAAEAPDRPVFRLTARLAPLVYPDRPDFDIEARLTGIDSGLSRLLSDWGIAASDVVLELTLLCRNGIIDEQHSKIVFRARDLLINPDRYRTSSGIGFARVTFPSRISGLLAPHFVDRDAAIADTVPGIFPVSKACDFEQLFTR